jgi:hypothetical protein
MDGMRFSAKDSVVGEDVVGQQITFLRYSHERIDLFKNSIYHRTTTIMAILAFMVSVYALLISDFFKQNPSPNQLCDAILALCFIVFLGSLFATLFFGIKSLFPVMNKSYLEDGFNIPGKMRFGSSKYVEGGGKREDYEALVDAAKVLNTSELIFEQTIYEIFTMSHQMNLRYNNVGRSCWCLYVALFSFVFTVIFYVILRVIKT